MKSNSYAKLNMIAIIAILLTVLVAAGCGDKVNVESVEVFETIDSREQIKPKKLSFLNNKEGWGSTYDSSYSGKVGPDIDTRISTPLFHYYDGRWHEISFQRNFSINDVYPLDKENVWAVGDYRKDSIGGGLGDEEALILHFDGESWTKTTWPTDHWLEGIAMASKDDGWIVGTHSNFLHFDGEEWTSVKGPKGAMLTDCDMPSKGDCWAVGNGIYHYESGKWKKVQVDTDRSLDSINMISTTEGWTVGDRGTILHYDGKSWIEQSSNASDNLTSVDMVSNECGWAVGNNGSILKYDGATWSVYEVVPDSQLSSVAAISNTECWIAGNGEEGYFVRHIKE